ncbi:helix-turn-helix domain-containing protein [Jannaschia donghaensis]|uniref:Helix-turn-helix protein n=1 Tax=Jannaschia donghaensis TaxID=420998 RepID=A0A0M6YLD8_9RHOB|nr:helix-turn-helix transcriptional regulator [Jannaschia donghaensis]CTQ51171.1 helix-turn-helix protein [Jannaschia donghaensis]
MPDDTEWFDPAATTFGDRLTGAREIAGLDVEELARRLGVKPKTIRAWEDDRSEPRANRISILAGLTNVSLMWLMTGTGDGPTLTSAEPEGDLLAEVERLRRDAARMADRLRMLEGRLRAQLEDVA